MDKIELQFDSEVIPSQSLEGKIGKLSRIIDVFPCDIYGNRLTGATLKEAQNVAVRIGDTVAGDEFSQFYEEEQFAEFRRLMAEPDPHKLVGKPVLSVYDGGGDSIGALRGLIPLKF